MVMGLADGSDISPEIAQRLVAATPMERIADLKFDHPYAELLIDNVVRKYEAFLITSHSEYIKEMLSTDASEAQAFEEAEKFAIASFALLQAISPNDMLRLLVM